MQLKDRSQSQKKKECILVGCVPFAAVAVLGRVVSAYGGGVFPGGVSAQGVSAWGCLPRGVSAQGVSA